MSCEHVRRRWPRRSRRAAAATTRETRTTPSATSTACATNGHAVPGREQGGADRRPDQLVGDDEAGHDPGVGDAEVAACSTTIGSQRAGRGVGERLRGAEQEHDGQHDRDVHAVGDDARPRARRARRRAGRRRSSRASRRSSRSASTPAYRPNSSQRQPLQQRGHGDEVAFEVCEATRSGPAASAIPSPSVAGPRRREEPAERRAQTGRDDRLDEPHEASDNRGFDQPVNRIVRTGAGDAGSGRLHALVERERAPRCDGGREGVVLGLEAEHVGLEVGRPAAAGADSRRRGGRPTRGSVPMCPRSALAIGSPLEGEVGRSVAELVRRPVYRSRTHAQAMSTLPGHLPDRSRPPRAGAASAAARGRGWQRGQEYDERFMNASRAIGVPQRRARPALLAVGVQRPVEVAALAVDVDVERVERRAALPPAPRPSRCGRRPSTRRRRRGAAGRAGRSPCSRARHSASSA